MCWMCDDISRMSLNKNGELELGHLGGQESPVLLKILANKI